MTPTPTPLTADARERLKAACDKATPGPWAVNPCKATVDAFDKDRPLSVCGCLWPTDERTEEQTEANADIIAAAPDALDWIAKALPILKRVENRMLATDPETWLDYEMQLATLTALIAQAEGQKEGE